jgi:WD40 repeat protein
VPEFTTQK